MTLSTQTLIWLFPLAFVIHDLEELILWEPWLAQNGAEVTARLPAFMRRAVGRVVQKSAGQAAISIGLIFCLTVVAAYLAAQTGRVEFLLFAAGAFFLHGFMHLGQAILLRRYVPAVVTSALVVIPYGWVLLSRLVEEGFVRPGGLLWRFAAAAVLLVPFILLLHFAGDWLSARFARPRAG